RYRTVDGMVERVTWGDANTRRGKFSGISVNMDFGDWLFLSELNRLDLAGSNFDTYMVSAGYRIQAYTPYISYAHFHSANEKHNTTSLGVRWDFHSNAAFKLQFDDVQDNGEPGWEVAGDSKSVSFGVDLVF
ncbi:MAG: porin, partial [Alkalimonas sp.]|nr:porin [Alkalimonas sp.]